MMKTILLEVRDSMTFIPVVAMDTDPGHRDVDRGGYHSAKYEERRWLLRRAGYSPDGSTIILVNLNDCRASNEPYGWNGRTMTVAHEYIERNWGELQDGDVIDVEFILGETTVKKTSERFER